MDSNLKNLLCLQINVDKSKAASLVAYVQAFEHNYDLILVQDPYSKCEFGIFARRAMVDQAREGLCYQ